MLDTFRRLSKLNAGSLLGQSLLQEPKYGLCVRNGLISIRFHPGLPNDWEFHLTEELHCTGRLGRKHSVRFDARFVNLMAAMVVVQAEGREIA